MTQRRLRRIGRGVAVAFIAAATAYAAFASLYLLGRLINLIVLPFIN